MGLQIAVSHGFSHVLLESYSTVALYLLTNIPIHPRFFPLLSSCKMLMKEIPFLQVSHFHREGNGVADALAELGRLRATPALQLFDFPPAIAVHHFWALDLSPA